MLTSIRKFAEIDVEATDSNGRTALYNAAWQNQLDVVKELILKNADPNNAPSADKITPLMTAASYGCGDVVEYLLKNKADANKTSRSGKTALIYAAEDDDAEINNKHSASVLALLSHNANPDIKDSHGETAIMHAKPHSKSFELLLTKSNLEIKDESGRTIFLRLCRLNHKPYLAGFKKLVDKHVNVNALDKNKKSALDIILENDSAEEDIIKKKIEILFSAKEPEFDPQLKEKALTEALESHSFKKMQILMDPGVKPKNSDLSILLNLAYNAGTFDKTYKTNVTSNSRLEKECTDKDGNTLIMRAIKDEKYDIAIKLAKISQLQLKNTKGESPLKLALNTDNQELIVQLIKAGADVNEVDAQGDILLMDEISCYSSNNAILLINNGADINFKSKINGNTPLISATKCHNENIVRAILAKMPKNLNEKNNEGETAFYIAIMNGTCDSDYAGCAKALIAAQADPYVPCRDEGYTVFRFGFGNCYFGNDLKTYKAKIDATKQQTMLSAAPHAVLMKPAANNQKSSTEEVQKGLRL